MTDRRPDTLDRGSPRVGARDTVALLAAWIAPITATVIATPFVLHRIGPAEYGLYAIVLGLVVSMATLGMSRPLAVSTAGGASAGARRATVWGIVLAVGGCLAVALLAALLPLRWLVGTDVDPGHARLTLLAGAFAVLGTALMSTVSGRALGGSRFVAVGLITATIGIATSLGYVAIAATRGTAAALVLWNGSVACLGAFLFLRAGRNRRPSGTPTAKPSDEHSVEPPSMWPFVIVQVAGNLAIVIERVGLGATSGLDAVTVFVVPHTMVLTLHAGLLWLTAPLLTRAVHLMRAGNGEGLEQTYCAASRLGAAVALFGGVTLAVLGHGVLDRWLGGDSVLASGPFLVLIIYAVGLPLTVVPWNIADATGHARENAIVGLAWLGLVVVGAIATHWFGIDATVVARAAMVVTLPAYIVRVERKAIGPSSTWNASWLAQLALAAALVGGLELVLWIGLGRTVPAAAAALLGGIIVFLTAMPRDLRSISNVAFGRGG